MPIPAPPKGSGSPAAVYGELLVGDKGRRQLLASYQQMHKAPVVLHREVVSFVARAPAARGRGMGWVDAHLLASALVGRLKLWTTDPQLATLAWALGVAHS